MGSNFFSSILKKFRFLDLVLHGEHNELVISFSENPLPYKRQKHSPSPESDHLFVVLLWKYYLIGFSDQVILLRVDSQ